MPDLTTSAAVDTFMGSADAAAMRTNSGATTVGSSLYILANPGAITFLRVNADNTVTALSAADFRTALSLGALATVVAGTGVATALAVNVGSAGAPVLFNGTLGTPSSGTLTNCSGLPVDGLSSGDLSADINLGTATGQIYFRGALSDGEFSGLCITGTAGATLAFGDLVYLAAADSRWELADATAASTSGTVKIGICVLAAAADADPTIILLQGNVRANTAFPAMTISAPMYISETAGDIVTAAPTTTDSVMRVVGFANTADELYFNPSGDYSTHV